MTIQTRLQPLYPRDEYSFDTNVYIELWRRSYPRDIFRTLWDDVENRLQNGVIMSTYAVKEELRFQRDELYEYLKRCPNLFVQPTPEEHRVISQLVNLEGYNEWGRGDSRRNYADPYVIALAKTHNLIVVTNENHHHISIPAACEELELECINFLGFLRSEELTY